MGLVYPVIGQWFSRANGTLFEVVALDEQAGTVELQHEEFPEKSFSLT